MAEYSRLDWAYREAFVCWASNPGDDYPYDHDHPDPGTDCDWGWICNADGCRIRVDDVPCPEHAPVAFPGLRLVECQAEPRHWLFSHDREDYGHGCPACRSKQLWAQLVELRVSTHRYRHGGWRRWRVTWWVVRVLRRVGLVRGSGMSWGDGCRGCVEWRWDRGWS